MTRGLLVALALAPVVAAAAQQDPFAATYAESCAVCHGVNMEGAAQGPPPAGITLKHGSSADDIAKSITEGFPQTGMPAWSATLDGTKIRRLAIFIAEKRSDLSYTDFKIGTPPPAVPDGPIKSETHAFRVQTFATGLDPLPYSIAPLPDGRILLTEKTRGLRIISRDGKPSERIRGTPRAYDDGVEMPGVQLVFGLGYLLDVALHPDYEKNGWIYLSYTDRCTHCNAASQQSRFPVSMTALIRGRIRNGEWVDQQSIWKADIETYTSMPDMTAGGRIAFDGKGHVFMSLGIKGGSESAGVQDLKLPYGKIIRLDDDGSIPADNPFVHVRGALC